MSRQLLWSALCGLLLGIAVLWLFPQAGRGVGELLYSSGVKHETYHYAVARAAPSVVNIYVQALSSTGQAASSGGVTSSASGVIMSSDGYIVTNYHVVPSVNAPEQAVWAQTRDGRLYQAFVAGFDRRTDLAVLKVDASGLPPIPIDGTYEPEVGDVVLAIGNPNNLGQTVSHGIVSATARSGSGLLTREQMNIREGLQDLIQTDAPINSGNSGGALVNTAGSLVGINTASFGGGQTYGISFAVPTTLVTKVMAEIIRHGRVVRGYLGISDDGTQALPSGGLGVRVGYIDPRGPAAGTLEVGDVITAVNGERVESVRALIEHVSASKPGSELIFSVLRAGRAATLKVTVTEDETSVD